jgi:hypothetical protein
MRKEFTIKDMNRLTSYCKKVLINEFIEDLEYEEDFWHPKGNYDSIKRLKKKWKKRR